MSMKKQRVDKRNSKPLTVEELEHDNSRFAKVVKAFLSIEDPESRTVPEIAKRVSDMYAGQYDDFEGVKVTKPFCFIRGTTLLIFWGLLIAYGKRCTPEA